MGRLRVSVAAAALIALAGCSKRDAPPAEHAREIGQWIWSSADSSVFDVASRWIDRVVPTVWIGTIHGTPDGRITSQLALSPRIAGTPRIAVVIRFEDDFHDVWKRGTDSSVAAEVTRSLQSIIGAAASTGVRISEVQLDYDCPVRLLPRWSAVVGVLTRDVLRGQSVWLTSLVDHVRRRDYGDLFRANVAGYILQVFDTGDRMSLPYAAQIQRLASRHRMPFRLGVAAFERELANGRKTQHREWFAAARIMSRSKWYRGIWVFPGGRSWFSLIDPS